MKPVQLVLIILLLAVLVVYFSRLRSGLLDRVVVLTFALLGFSMAAIPDWTNWLAYRVGVASGAHLFIYLSILGLGFFGLIIYSKLRDLQASITHLTRTIAIQQAVPPADAPDAANRRDNATRNVDET